MLSVSTLYSVDDKMIDECEAAGRMIIGRWKSKYLKKTCPSVTLSTTNPTWPDLGLKSATNRRSYATIQERLLKSLRPSVCVN
jgi:hypothetical protein